MDQCPKCKGMEAVKDGIVLNRQRYKCKKCNYRYTVAALGKPEKLKREALKLHSKGLSFREVAKVLNVGHVSVYNWKKNPL